MFLPGVKIGVIASVLIIFLVATNARFAKSFTSKIYLLVIVYIIYATFSILFFYFQIYLYLFLSGSM